LLETKIRKRYRQNICHPGNPGISRLGQCYNLELGPKNFKDIADFALEKQIGCTIVGPELPLTEGIVDYFNSRGLRIFGPDKKLL